MLRSNNPPLTSKEVCHKGRRTHYTMPATKIWPQLCEEFIKMCSWDTHQHDFGSLWTINDEAEEYVGKRKVLDIDRNDNEIDLFAAIFLGIRIRNRSNECYIRNWFRIAEMSIGEVTYRQ